MVKHTRLMFVNVLAVLGYVSCLLQFVWAALPFLPSLMHSRLFTIMNSEQQPAQQLPEIHPSGVWAGVLLVLAIIVVIIAFIIMIMAFRRAPKVIEKSAAKAVHAASDTVIPIITHHAKLTPKKRRLLTARLLFDFKLLIVALPVIVGFFAPVMSPTMSHDLYLFIAALMAGWSLLLFCLQVGLAKAFKLDLGALW